MPMIGWKTIELPSMAYEQGAAEFAKAAMTLQRAKQPQLIESEFDPVLLLSAQSIELSLKGYLRWTGIPSKDLGKTPYGHNLISLLQACEERGLRLPDNEREAMRNLMWLLNDGNVEQGLRYYTLADRDLPRSNWAAEGAVLLARLTDLQSRGPHPSGVKQPNVMTGAMHWAKPGPDAAHRAWREKMRQEEDAEDRARRKNPLAARRRAQGGA